MEYAIGTKAPFDHDVDRIAERVGDQTAVVDLVRRLAVGHLKDHALAARVALDRAVHHARTDLHAGLPDAGISDDLRLQLRGREEVDRGVPDGPGHEDTGGAEHYGSTD